MNAASPGPLLAFGAHPDDIEFGCGGIIAREAAAGRHVHFVVCSQGEAGTNGRPRQRLAEARAGAAALGATIEFLTLDGDAHLEIRAAHSIRIAGIIRRQRPLVVLAPTLERNQHPDHWRLGQIVVDATRLARFGGVRELKSRPVHRTGRLFFYAIAPEAESTTLPPVAIDISASEVVRTWTAAMNAHASQMRTRNYVDLQLVRARAWGARVGVGHAQVLYPNEPLVFAAVGDIGGPLHA
ncbi:MAG TPA: PIG-L family deacetylase [Candidatus Didemnitutus sp.]|jgi:LmbE family N-acetylglucosaminyl deacetylase